MKKLNKNWFPLELSPLISTSYNQKHTIFAVAIWLAGCTEGMFKTMLIRRGPERKEWEIKENRGEAIKFIWTKGINYNLNFCCGDRETIVPGWFRL